MESGIYRIFNNINSNCYIGSSSNIKTRIRTHKYKLRNNKHYNKHLQSSWNKYLEANFIFEILENCERDVLRKREQYYIDLYNPEYNKSKNADSYTDIKLKQESIEKFAKTKRGKKLSNDCINNMKNSWKRTRNEHPLCKLNDIKIVNLINNFNSGISIDLLVEKYLIKRKTILGVIAGRSWKEFTYLVDKEKQLEVHMNRNKKGKL